MLKNKKGLTLTRTQIVTAVIILVMLIAGAIVYNIFKDNDDEKTPNPNSSIPENTIKYHIFDGVEGYTQHPKAKGKIITWNEYLEKEKSIQDEEGKYYLLFTHKNYHLQGGESVEQYIIDYYYPNDLDNKVKYEDLQTIYFIDLSDIDNYNSLYDEVNGIIQSQISEKGNCSIDDFKLATYPAMIFVGKSSVCGGNHGYFSRIVGDQAIINFYLKVQLKEVILVREEFNVLDNFNYDEAFADDEWRKLYKNNLNRYE